MRSMEVNEKHPLEVYRAMFVAACSEQELDADLSHNLFDQLNSEQDLASALQQIAADNSASANDFSLSDPFETTFRKGSSVSSDLHFDETLNKFVPRRREKPAQMKLEREIELASDRAEQLRCLQSVRQLTAIEIDELKLVELAEYEAKKKLKRTKDAAVRAKRYRVRRAQNMERQGPDSLSQSFSSLKSDFDNSQASEFNLSPEDLRPSSSSAFDPLGFLTEPSRKRSHSSATPNSFLCSQCDSTFGSLATFVAHMRTQHLKSCVDESTLCRICKLPFPNAAARLAHTVEHFIGSSTTFSCQQCGKTFDNGTLFRHHHQLAHTEVLHRCGVCLKLFNQTSVYNEHMMTHVQKETRYFCVACTGLGFENLELLEAHVQLVHDRTDANGATNTTPPASKRSCQKQSNGTGPSSSTAPVPSSTTTSTRSLKCFVCDKDCVDETALDEHRLLNHCKVPKSDRCAICRQVLEGVLDFVQHTQDHSDGVDMHCVVCRQVVRNENQLRMHAEYHLDLDNSTQCSVCGDAVPPHELTQHFLGHAAGLDLDAVRAEAADDSDSVKTSTPPHEPSTPLVCHCGQQFEDQSELTTHALEHLSEALPSGSGDDQTSHDCPKCPKRFTSLSALQGHSHVHMTPKVFRCPKCGQIFSSATRLQQHRLKHLNKNNVKCRICDQRFTTTEQLQSHMRVHENSLGNFAANSLILPVKTEAALEA